MNEVGARLWIKRSAMTVPKGSSESSPYLITHTITLETESSSSLLAR